MSGPLDGKVALVTGASRGIGLAVASRLVADGASVVLTARTREAAQAAADSIGPSAIGYGAHAADADAAEACVAFAVERFGALDILVNNAGTNPAVGPVVDIDHARFAKTIDVNLWAPLLWTGVAVRAWMGEHGGAVVNVSSIGGMVPGNDTGVYRVTKAALIHLTRQLAFELAPGVRVNAVAPGLVRTRLAEGLWKDDEERATALIPAGRLGEPFDVAGAIAFLVGPDAAWVTGETLVADGGQLLGVPGTRQRVGAAS